MIAVVLVLVVVAGAVVVTLRARSHDADDTSAHGELVAAMTHALADGQRFSWTDWAAVRSQLGLDVGIDSSAADLRHFLTRGFDADLTSTSVLLSSAQVLQEHYAFSPTTLSWELYTQAPADEVDMFGLTPGTDVGAIEDALRTIGYTPPTTPDGMWRGNLDDIKRIGDVTPELTFIYIDADAGVMLSSDTDTGLAKGQEAYRAAAGVAGGLGDVVGAVGEPTTAALDSADQVCKALAMSGADPVDQTTGQQLLDQAGDVNPLTGFALADQPGGETLAVLSFETEDQARTNATTRAKLASGPAPGQGGTFPERFTLGRVEADGRVVTMQLDPVRGAYVLSDLSNGPLLFATC